MLRSKLTVLMLFVLTATLAIAARPLLSNGSRQLTAAAGDPDPAQEAHAVAVAIEDDKVLVPPAPRDIAGALDAARAHAPIARLLSQRHELLLARTYTPGEDALCEPAACVELTLYVYPTNDVVVALVERGSARVVRAQTEKGQPALSPREQKRAHAIADADADLRRHLARAPHSHPVLAYPMWRDVAPCDVDRCASVVYPLDEMTATGIGRQATVVVDLSTERVVERVYLRCTPDCEPGWS